MKMRLVVLAAAILGSAVLAGGEGLPGPAVYTDFPVSRSADFPGVFSAEGLLDKPAGKDGPIVVKGGHFYTNLEDGKRIRFFGVNFCFGANFPTHQEADLIAPHLAKLGINAVRFHHMDSQPFPNGIFKDWKLEELDPVALDRLDYFIARLKENGVYADLNLHVSRDWARAHKVQNFDKVPEMGKLIGLFDADLIQAQKDYAHDLLTHVNAYTKNAYSNEPAVCMVEINNENTFFTWGGDEWLAKIPEPYAGELQGIWNKWLMTKYGSREKVAAAWNGGVQVLGENMLNNPALQNSPWDLEQHPPAKMSLIPAADKKSVTLTIGEITDTNWHLQFKQGGLTLKKGQFYTLKFTASADSERTVAVGAGQNHDPWGGLGLQAQVKLEKTPKDFVLHFTATGDDDNARLSFIVGQKTGKITLGHLSLGTGGQEGLLAAEDPAQGTVARLAPETGFTKARLNDWYDFLQMQDQAYFTGMFQYLRGDLHVHSPITGTIGMGALGTLSQTKMDYVDAHAYWDHPQFPGRAWDTANWRLHNTPMVDSPEHGTLAELAARRVAGKPFTVTEYNHASPNEWQAECLPLIATFGALQDWDAIYLFAWSHGGDFQNERMDNYFDLKDNVVKLSELPAASRIFLSGAVKPLPGGASFGVSRRESLGVASAFMTDLWGQLGQNYHLTPDLVLRRQMSISFDSPGGSGGKAGTDPRALSWAAAGAGTGQFYFADPAAAVFVGFPKRGQKISLGPVELSGMENPFVAATLVSADGKTALTKSSRLLLTLAAREENTGMQWNAARTTVGTNWGKAPERVEAAEGMLSVPAGFRVYPVDADGVAGKVLPAVNGVVNLKGAGTIWFELAR